MTCHFYALWRGRIAIIEDALVHSHRSIAYLPLTYKTTILFGLVLIYFMSTFSDRVSKLMKLKPIVLFTSFSMCALAFNSSTIFGRWMQLEQNPPPSCHEATIQKPCGHLCQLLQLDYSLGLSRWQKRNMLQKSWVYCAVPTWFDD